jgi:hypothetical protein
MIGTAGNPAPANAEISTKSICENNSDGSFEWRGTRYSLRKCNAFEFFQNDRPAELYWESRGTSTISHDDTGNAVLKMPWPDPMFVQTLAPLRLPAGKYRLSFRTNVNVDKQHDIAQWSAVLKYWHTQMPWRKSNVLSVQLNAWKNNGEMVSHIKPIRLLRGGNWQKQSIDFEMKEYVSGPILKLQTWPEYDETVLVDDIKLEVLP